VGPAELNFDNLLRRDCAIVRAFDVIVLKCEYRNFRNGNARAKALYELSTPMT
jgi:hypothetical protein